MGDERASGDASQPGKTTADCCKWCSVCVCVGRVLGRKKKDRELRRQVGKAGGERTEQRGRSLMLNRRQIRCFDPRARPPDGRTHRQATRLDSVTQLDVYLHMDVSGCNNMFTTILDGGDVAFWLHSAGFFCVFFFSFTTDSKCTNSVSAWWWCVAVRRRLLRVRARVCFCLRYLCPGRHFQSPPPSPTAIRVSILNVTISPSIFDEAYFFFPNNAAFRAQI